MRSATFTHAASDGKSLFVYRWLPDEGTKPKGIVHIAHGMAEHAGRYAHVGEALTRAGYAVYADDHRGHGKTASGPDELGFITSSGGFDRVVSDLAELIAREKADNPGLPAFLFGHSMGSFLTQRFMFVHGDALRGAVLTATCGRPPPIAVAGKLIARFERLRLGERGRSKLLNSLSFDDFNKPFRPNRTAFDWLTRDEAEVDKYVADPLCGFICTTALWVDFLDALSDNAKLANQAKIPKDLPVYVFGGSRDPVGANTKSVLQLLASYREAGLRDVTHTFYEGGRHEMVNETNREAVFKDLVAWLDRTAAKTV